MKNKVVIIGCGNVGMSYAYCIVNQKTNIQELVLLIHKSVTQLILMVNSIQMNYLTQSMIKDTLICYLMH